MKFYTINWMTYILRMTVLWKTKYSFDTASQNNTLYDSQCESNCIYGILRTPFTLITDRN